LLIASTHFAKISSRTLDIKKTTMGITAVCHVHSDWSYDAKWSLNALSAKFSRKRCRVLMMTEHDRGFTTERLAQFRAACAEASSNQLLIMPGIEYSDSANRVHVLVWGDVPFLGEGVGTAEVLQAVRASNGVAVLAHPKRRDAWKCFKPCWADSLLGIEVWNRKYDGWAPSETTAQLLQDSSMVPFVGLDFHAWNQSFPLTMSLDVESKVTEATVLDCLRKRRLRPYAFGKPIAGTLFQMMKPTLHNAEAARRALASVRRKLL
jgi:hypothetical protein